MSIAALEPCSLCINEFVSIVVAVLHYVCAILLCYFVFAVTTNIAAWNTAGIVEYIAFFAVPRILAL